MPNAAPADGQGPAGHRLTARSETIYGNHMSDHEKTTVYLDPNDYRRLKGLARSRDAKAAELIREAVAEYVVRHAPVRQPKSLGKFSSGRTDIGERAEDLLDGMGRDR